MADGKHRIAVLGSTGGTGRLIIRKLLQHDGVDVVAVARSPAALDGLVAELGAGPRLTVLQGDLLDAASLAPAMAGVDVVVFAAGVASIKQAATSRTTVYSVGGQNMLDAMKAAGIKRLVAITSQGVQHDPSAHWFYRFFLQPLLLRDMYADMRRLEALATSAAAAGGLSSLTLLRPTQLMDGPVAGRPPAVVGEGLVAAGSAFQVDRADLAGLVVDAALQPGEYGGKTLFICC